VTFEPAWSSRRTGLLYAAAFAAVACVTPYLSWSLSDRGASVAAAGAAVSVLTLAAVAAAPLWGLLSDRRPDSVLQLAFAAGAIAALSLALAPLPLVFAAAAAFGAATGALEALLTASVFRRYGPQAPVGDLRRWASLAWCGGLIVTAAVVTHWPAGVFVCSAAIFAVAAGAARVEAGSSERSHRGRLRRLKPIVRLVVQVLPLSCALFTMLIFVGALVHERGSSPWLIALAFGLTAILEVPALGLAQRLARRLSSGRLILLAFPLAAAAYALLGAYPTVPMLIVVQPLFAAVFALWFVGQSGGIARLAESADLGVAQSLAAAATKGVAGTVAGVGGGALAATAGFSTLFFVQAALCLAGLLIWVYRSPLG
jgi:hypothetical protein